MALSCVVVIRRSGEIAAAPILVGLALRMARSTSCRQQQGVEHRVIPWEDVSEEEGTGIVHIAPGAGKEDFALAR